MVYYPSEYDQYANLPRFMFLTEAFEVAEVVKEYFRILEINLCRGAEFGLVVSVDSETTGLNIKLDRISIFSFYADEYLTIPSLGIDNEKVSFVSMGGTLGRDDCLLAFRPICESPEIVKCGANISGFDYFMFANHGIEIVDPIHDTIVMSWCYNENRTGRHGLKQCALELCKLKMQDYKTAGGGEMDIRYWPFEAALRYPAIDAFAGLSVWSYLKKALQSFHLCYSDITFWEFYIERMVPVQRVLRNMMGRGIAIDIDHLNSLAPVIQSEMLELEKWFNCRWQELQVEQNCIYITPTELSKDEARLEKGRDTKYLGKAPRPLNTRSNPMLHFLYFTLLKHPVLKKNVSKTTGEENPSLKREVLEEYAEMGCEFSDKLLRYRQLDKLYGTYIGDEAEEDSENYSGRKEQGGLRSKIVDGRVYTNFKVGPVTGRLASSGPNLMNIPTRTPLGKEVKQAFTAPDGYDLIAADYGQLEMRLFAHFAQEESMIQAILNGKDLHCVTASLMFGISYEDVHIAKLVMDKEWAKLQKIYGLEEREPTDNDKLYAYYRDVGKTIGFALLYGAGPKKIGMQIGKSWEEAKIYIDMFFAAYPGAKLWMDLVFSDCIETGIVWTHALRPRRLDEINSAISWIAARARRQAVNSIIQGSAADFVLLAMIRVEDSPVLKMLGCELLLQVHDELVFQCPSETADAAMAVINELMHYPVSEGLSVPLPISIHRGKNWREAK